jgi:hypothetical protein
MTDDTQIPLAEHPQTTPCASSEDAVCAFLEPMRGTVAFVTYGSAAKQVRAGRPTDCGCESVFPWFGGGSTWLEYPL